MSATATSMTVDNADAFPNCGIVIIDSDRLNSERAAYTAKSGNTLENVQRSLDRDAPVPHQSGALVRLLSSATCPVGTPLVRIDIGSANGGVGEAVSVTVSLHAAGATVAATSNSIGLRPPLAISSCELNPALEVLGKSLVLSGVFSGVRLVVQSRQNTTRIPDGRLYTCAVQIAENAQQGSYILRSVDAEAFSPAGTRLSGVAETDGFVTVSFVRPSCVGDCDGSGQVTVEELITGVNIALDLLPLSNCPQFDSDGSGFVSVDELVRGVCSCPQLAVVVKFQSSLSGVARSAASSNSYASTLASRRLRGKVRLPSRPRPLPAGCMPSFTQRGSKST